MHNAAAISRLVILVLCSLLFAATTVAQTPAPKTISYQGYLTDFSGQPLNGAYTLAFQLHDASSGGTALWAESHSNQSVVNGNFSVMLGSQTAFPASLNFGQQLWLQVEVTTPGGQVFLLSPRIVFQSTPYANFAHDVADGAVTTDKLSPQGATSDGQVLTYDAGTGNVHWRTPQAGGSGNLSLPFSGTASDTGTLFSVTNTGTGKAGFFEVNNTGGSLALSAQSNATESAAIYGLHYGNGVAGQFVNSDPANTHEALRAITVGAGSAGVFEVQNTASNGTALDVKTLGTGVAGRFRIDNTSSGETALRASTNGTGAAGFFDVTSSTNTNTALDVRTGGLGTAAAFNVQNTVNNSPVLRAQTNGTGVAAAFDITNAASESPAVMAQTVGLGRAGLFAIDRVQSIAPALEATTNGLGYAGLFHASPASEAAATLSVFNEGFGFGARISSSLATNTRPALIARTSGTGHSSYFVGGKGVLVETATGSDEGGVSGRNDVVARFSSNQIGTPADHAAVSIEAGLDKNASLYFSNDGAAMWEMGHRQGNDDDFRLVYHGGVGKNLKVMDVNYFSDSNIQFSLNAWLFPSADDTYSLGASNGRWTSVYATNGTIQTSDRRLKSHITDLGYGLDEVLALRPVAYQWKDKPEQGTKLGLIAQEVETVVPEVVHHPEEAGGYLGMSYTELVPVLIRAIQQQQQIIAQQQAALGTLEKQMAQVAHPHDKRVLTVHTGN